MKRYNVKNKGIDVITVYDSHGKGYVLKRNQMCNIDTKPTDVAGLMVEEIEDKKPDTRKIKKDKYIEVK